MYETGIIKEINGDDAVIMLIRTDACKGCSGCLISSDGKSMLLTVKSISGASAGDRVTIELNSRQFLLSSFIVLLLPILMFFTGVFTGSRFLHLFFASLDENIAGLIAGLVFLLISIVVVYLIERRRTKKSAFMPRIIQIEKPPFTHGVDETGEIKSE